MIKLITAAERHNAEVGGWLKSSYHLSFADYYDSENVEFGPLRVFNEDVIKPHAGFPSHPHAEMEIVNIVFDGELTHKDDLGHEEKVGAGSVQRITAGTGINVSATNDTDNPLHVFQLWFLPNKRSLAPSYEHMTMDFLDTKNNLVPLVTGQKVLENVTYINSNSTVYYGNLGQGESYDFKTFKIRKTLVYLIEGSMLINNMEVDKNDQVRLEFLDVVSLHGRSDAKFLLIDVPAAEANY